MSQPQRYLSCEEINAWDMVHYLAELGHHPKGIRGQDYWYLSPLREERTASFKVYRKGNVWYDHGLGQGGGVVDFCLAYFGGNVRGLLQRLTDQSVRPMPFQGDILREPDDPEKHIQIESVDTLSTGYLKHYLMTRNIPLKVGLEYCSEVTFSMHRKSYHAIGFLNRSGGYALRNSWFKGSSSPNDFSLLRTGASRVSVFEGFFDFLTYQSLPPKHTAPSDFLILNSLSFIQRSLPVLGQYPAIDLYLDRGPPAQKKTTMLLTHFRQSQDKSLLYKGFDDLNEWHCGQPTMNHKQRKKGLRH